MTDLLKRLLLGRALRSDRLGETLLPKRVALPVFASDPRPSVAHVPGSVRRGPAVHRGTAAGTTSGNASGEK